jgi:hypothetical protein
MAKVLRSNVKHDGELIIAGTRMSSNKFPVKLRKQLKEDGFFVDEVDDDDDEVDEVESDDDPQTEEEEGPEEEDEDEEVVQDEEG